MNTQNIEKTDLRIVKTHKNIRETLINLLEQKPFREITVQDILETAMINRTTFYRHYAGKSDLAAKMIADFKQVLAERMKERLETEEEDVAEFYTKTTALFMEERRVMLALWKVDTPKLHLYRDMHQMIRQHFLKLAVQKGINHEIFDLDYQSHIFATLALESARYHFERNQPIEFEFAILNIQAALDMLKF